MKVIINKSGLIVQPRNPRDAAFLRRDKTEGVKLQDGETIVEWSKDLKDFVPNVVSAKTFLDDLGDKLPAIVADPAALAELLKTIISGHVDHDKGQADAVLAVAEGKGLISKGDVSKVKGNEVVGAIKVGKPIKP